MTLIRTRPFGDNVVAVVDPGKAPRCAIARVNDHQREDPTRPLERGTVSHPRRIPDLAHDDEVDACSGALEMLNVQMKGAAIFEFYRQKAEKLKQPTTTTWVRLRAPPPGTGSVQIFTNHYNMRPDGTFEVLAEDAEILIRRGWTKVAESGEDTA